MPCDFTRPTWSGRRSGRPPRFDLAGSNVLACTIDDLDGARDALSLSGSNDNGYAPLVEAIAQRYGVAPERVATATGAAGANFQVCAALLEPGDDVLMERPGYDPLLGAARLLGANVVRFERRFEDGYALDPERVARAITPRTRLIIITRRTIRPARSPIAAALEAVGRHRAKRWARTCSSTRSISTPRTTSIAPAARSATRSSRRAA